ncbi:DUF2239 family protein [Lysobacter pythonis]|uniref:DUF2239 family protein n=1 Tax=Solilutibacter pythonis TaxID=2483112 RepID=A0A3M2HYP9_9GAMM|nr:DUF2239 family protein [Lysobacter pythonis]
MRPGTRCTAFLDDDRIAAGELRHVALRARDALVARPEGRLRVFDDRDARPIALDLGGSAAEIVQRLSRGELPASRAAEPEPPKRGRGRPRLGVVAREVTLLPADWQWLSVQPGGASLAIRRLVDAARGADPATDPSRAGQARTWRFLLAVGAERPGFEEAARALFAGDAPGFEAALNGWPEDLREHAGMLAAGVWRH